MAVTFPRIADEAGTVLCVPMLAVVSAAEWTAPLRACNSMQTAQILLAYLELGD
jgi:hypothetical protein